MGEILTDLIPGKDMVGYLRLLRVMLRALVPARRVVGPTLIVIGVAALVAVSSAGTARAAPPDIMDDCEACHLPPIPLFGVERPTPLKGHDKLGDGDNACAACHDNDNKHLRMLSSAGGKMISFSESPKLCGQCHQKRYDQWVLGIHGVPQWSKDVPGMSAAQNKTAWPAGQYNVGQNTEGLLAAILKVEPNFLGGERKNCTDCHDPHAPQIVLTSVIKPHPGAIPSQPPTPVTPFVVLGGSLLLAIGVGAAIGRKGG